MRVEDAQVYKDGNLLWANVAGDLDERLGTFTVKNRGIPRPGNYELRLAGGRRLAMRSGVPDHVATRVDGTTAYFTLNAILK
jgi:hypothetical protein